MFLDYNCINLFLLIIFMCVYVLIMLYFFAIVWVNDIIIEEVKRIVSDANMTSYTDRKWPEPDKVGKQEMLIKLDGKECEFVTTKFGAYNDVVNSADKEGLTAFWYLVQDLKCLVLSLINAHFRVKPVN